MPKHYSVTPVQRPGKRVYSANFRTVAEIRVTRSLRTEDRDAARMICAGLVSLWNAKVKSFDGVPAGTPSEAVKLFFEIPESNETVVALNATDLANLASIRAELDRFPVNARAQAFLILTDRYKLKNNLEALQTKYTGLKNDFEVMRTDYEALKRSVVARVADSAASMPSLAESIQLFESHLSTTTTKANTKIHVALAKRFIGTLPSLLKTLAEVRPEHVGKFLDDETSRTNSTKPLARRRNLRIRLARFINWGAKKYDYPSQMRNVEGVKRKNLRRERGEIKWHELTEIESVIKALDKVYWRALVATLAYAGLQLAELCWLRREDVMIDGKCGRIWIGPVTDPTDPESKHLLKTGNRERHVDIHPTRLLPRLREYLATIPAGQVFFFPMLSDMRRRKRGAKGHFERWLPSVLSTVLRGHKGGKNQKKRPAKAGILPKGMTAATLRHTFGSLLLRSKDNPKSYAQVAAAMGNSESVVAEYYAKLKGSDVKVDF